MPAAPVLRLGELVATFALAQDNAFGQPLESQLCSCLLATWMAEEAGYDAGLKETIYWTALLRYLGCTGHAHEVAVYLGDEIAARARTLVRDAANPAEVASDVITLASAARPDQDPEQVARAVMATIQEWAVSNFGAGCEVADLLAHRLGFSAEVRQALACTFERWNGLGVPRGVAGEDIPLAMRVVHVSHDMEAIARLVSPVDALAAVQLLLTEVFGTGATLTASAVQPFNLNADGSLTPISRPVGSGQIAVCWITVSGQNVYTTNYLTNDITSYTVGSQGSLAVNDPVAGGAQQGTLVTPIDQALSPDGHFLYQLSPGNGTLVPFAINGGSGSLTQLTPVSDGLGTGQSPQGIAAVDFN